MNVASSPDSQKYQQVPSNSVAGSSNLDDTDADIDPISASPTKAFKLISDKVLPPLSEIMHCIKNKLVSRKDLILYKLVLDLNEALVNQRASVAEYHRLARYSHDFYKNLSDEDLKQLHDQMQGINATIRSKAQPDMPNQEGEENEEDSFSSLDSKCSEPFSMHELITLSTRSDYL